MLCLVLTCANSLIYILEMLLKKKPSDAIISVVYVKEPGAASEPPEPKVIKLFMIITVLQGEDTSLVSHFEIQTHSLFFL